MPPLLGRVIALGLAAAAVLTSPCDAFVHDTVLVNHVPSDASCECIQWTSNASSARLWESKAEYDAAGSACAMPANALTPDLGLPIYSPSDGWCLCAGDGGTGGSGSTRDTRPDPAASSRAGSNWYSWCQPPASHPSQINLLVVNGSAVGVNFVTSDAGARSGCPVVAEVRHGDTHDPAGSFTGYSTLYRDSESSRQLSYHHVTLGPIAERTAYSYRVRVINASTDGPAPPTPPPTPVVWRKTTGIEWCSGSNWLPGDPFGNGFDDAWCPYLRPNTSHDQKVSLCEAVCAATNASACAGFTLYPDVRKSKTGAGAAVGVCCFRGNTDSKPKDPSSTAECYEKEGGPNPNRPRCHAAASEWSDWLDFTSLYTGGADGRPTKLALYADMGVFVAEGKYAPPVTSLPAPARHNVGNLVDDLAAGKIDFAIHSGDHAYEFEVNGGARGDGFMDSYSAFLAHAPWAPGWGNHEYLEEDRGNRLANISAGIVAERKKVAPATTRMWYSVEVGMLHLLHLDLSPYWCRFSGCIGVDTCGVPDEWVIDASSADPATRYNFTGYRDEVMAFARADLAAVNRTSTPWVMVTAHFPLYDTISTADLAKAAASEPDYGARGPGPKGAIDAPVPSKAQALADFEPLLAEFAVDFYFAGHNHNYETTWPVYNGVPRGEKSYTDPVAPIHVLSGTAGPPEWDVFGNGTDWSRIESRRTVNSYSRMTLHNATVAHFEQVANDNGTIVDSFDVVQRRSNRSAPFPCFPGPSSVGATVSPKHVAMGRP